MLLYFSFTTITGTQIRWSQFLPNISVRIINCPADKLSLEMKMQKTAMCHLNANDILVNEHVTKLLTSLTKYCRHSIIKVMYQEFSGFLLRCVTLLITVY
jgi:hypothetical protein